MRLGLGVWRRHAHCSPSSTTTVAVADDEAGHAHHAPHGGTLVELGDHFAHLELLFDAGGGIVTLWVLDGEAEQAVRLTQETVAIIVDAPASVVDRPLELLARASSLTGERVGDASEFALTHGALRGLPALSGRILEMTVRGQAFQDVRFDLPAGPVDH